MSIRFACPKCASVLKIADRKAGAEVSCPKCGQMLVVPSPSGVQEDPAEQHGKAGGDIQPDAEYTDTSENIALVPPSTALVLYYPSEPKEPNDESDHQESGPPKSRRAEWEITHNTGEVDGFHRQTDARIHGGGSISTTPRSVTTTSRATNYESWYASVSGWFAIDTEHIDRCDFWVRDKNGHEEKNAFPDRVVPVRDGQRVSPIYVLNARTDYQVCVAIVNHTAYQVIGVIEPLEALDLLDIEFRDHREVLQRARPKGLFSTTEGLLIGLVGAGVSLLLGLCLLPVGVDARSKGGIFFALLFVALGLGLAVYAIFNHSQAPKTRSITVKNPTRKEFLTDLKVYIDHVLRTDNPAPAGAPETS